MFIPAPQHELKDGKGLYCKPTCYLHRNDGRKKPCGSGRKASKISKCTERGEVVKVYESVKEAERLDGYNEKSLRKSLSAGITYKGFIWKYHTDFDNAKGCVADS